MENKEQRPTSREKKTLISIAVFAFCAFIMDLLICLITYYAAMGQFNKSLEHDKEQDYVVNEETKVISSHLLDYLKDNTLLVSPTNTPEKIVGFSFDSGHLNIAAEDHDNTLFYYIETAFTEVDDALNSFKDKKPQVDAYPIDVKIEKNDDSKLNPQDCKKYVGHASYIDGVDTRYVSFIGQHDENNIYSCVHKEYQENGLYDTKKANVTQHPLLYDFLYYALYN